MDLKYSAADIRYTQSRDGQTVYAILLGSPDAGTATTLTSFSTDMAIKNVSLLASDEVVDWSQSDDGLKIASPKSKIDSAAIAYKIELK